MRFVTFVCLLLAAVLVCSTLAQAGPVSAKLKADELARVKKGEIILKNIIDEQTQKGYGSAFAVYKGTKDEFWKVILDYEHYLDIYPRLKKVTPISKTADTYLVEFYLDASIKTIIYTTINKLSADKSKVSWTLDPNRPHEYLKRTDGYWQLEELEPGLLLAEYRVEVELDMGTGVIASLVNRVVRAMSKDDLPEVMDCTRKRLESGGTWKRKK